MEHRLMSRNAAFHADRSSGDPLMRARCVFLLAVAMLMVWPRSIDAQTLTSVLTYPANLATNADMTQPFQWTAVPNVQAYYLYVGTSVGAKDLVNTGEVQQTSYMARSLPVGQTLYARIYTKISGVWRFADSTFTAAPVTKAAIIYPAGGTVDADMSLPIEWTPVPNVQAYYLYVGTSVGAKDLVNTGEIQQTSYLATSLPAGPLLYARMHTKVDGVWRHVDSTFTAGPLLRARITSPVDGASAADLSQPIQWTTIAGSQAYYLYVGTTVGAKDLVNTGEVHTTSYLASGLPAGKLLYARMYTKVGGTWRYIDSTFSVAPIVKATITFPADGSVADVANPIEWTPVPAAQAYYLYVGSAPGGNDLVNTGEIHATTFLAGNLPIGRTVYARLWTKIDAWRYTDSSFTTAALATLIYPADHAADIDQSQPFRWNAIDNAEAYYLYVGSTPGANDLVNSYEITSTSYLTSRGGLPLPAGPTLYARLWTKLAGEWQYHDSTFTASPMTPKFIYPTDGATGVDPTQPFRWVPPANATAFELRIGTTPGGTDVFKSGTLSTTSATPTGLPATGTLYARALAKVNTTWTFTDVAFTLSPSVTPATIISPVSGAVNVDTGQAFQWTAVSLARGYRLTIGRAPGGNDLHDSGEIQVTRRFVPNLPIGQSFGTIMTKLNGVWYSTAFTFSVAANTLSVQSQIDAALWATHLVRGMAAVDNRPYSWTPLAKTRFLVTCADYAATLLQVWSDINGQLPARRLDITLNPNGYDAHTIDEMFNSATQSWMLLDPTFDLSVKRSSDGGWATAEDVSAATHNQQWSNVSYTFLGSLGDYYARRYSIDYPLLYNDIYHAGQTWTKGQGAPVLPFMQQVAMQPTGTTYTFYTVGCSGVQSTIMRINGVDQTIDCSGVDGLSNVFGATTVTSTAQTDPSVKLYRPRRFVF
jgi:hypothetical protein